MLTQFRISRAEVDPSQDRLTNTELGEHITVASPVAHLVQPILDEQTKLQSGRGGDERELGRSLSALVRNNGRAADEALVVLLCFRVGESQEEVDAVISRGKKMLVYLKKYQHRNPQIPDRGYPDSMRKSELDKALVFEGAIKAIREGLRGTWDNPEG